VGGVKYKHIASAIYNFGHSFTSAMNYVDDGYVIEELGQLHRQGTDIEVDWLTGRFAPSERATPRIQKSIERYRHDLARHLISQNVVPKAIVQLKFHWPARRRKYMLAVDDRGKEHKMYVNEMKGWR
jgi:hypothetical protein